MGGCSIATYDSCRAVQVLSDTEQVPSIEVLLHCILICLHPLTAIILHNKVYLLPNEGADTDHLLTSLIEVSRAHFTQKPSSKYLCPFELAALEILLDTVFTQHHQTIEKLEEEFSLLEERLKVSVKSVELARLHYVKNTVHVYMDRVKAFEKAFVNLLSNPDDIKRMDLTRNWAYAFSTSDTSKSKDVPLDLVSAFPDMEILLGYFDQQVQQFISRVTSVQQSIDSTEKLITLRGAFARNRLIYIDLMCTLLSLGVIVAAGLSSIFTMNLESYLSESFTAFVIVGMSSLFLAVGGVFLAIYVLVGL